jgi:hypothetical protein
MFELLLFSRRGMDFGKLKLALKYQSLKAPLHIVVVGILIVLPES